MAPVKFGVKRGGGRLQDPCPFLPGTCPFPSFPFRRCLFPRYRLSPGARPPLGEAGREHTISVTRPAGRLPSPLSLRPGLGAGLPPTPELSDQDAWRQTRGPLESRARLRLSLPWGERPPPPPEPASAASASWPSPFRLGAALTYPLSHPGLAPVPPPVPGGAEVVLSPLWGPSPHSGGFQRPAPAQPRNEILRKLGLRWFPGARAICFRSGRGQAPSGAFFLVFNMCGFFWTREWLGFEALITEG